MLRFILAFILVTLVTSHKEDKEEETNVSINKRGELLWSHTTFPSSGGIPSDFHATGLWGADSISYVTDPAGGSSHVLRVHYPAGSYSQTNGPHGAGFYATPTPRHTAMMLCYDVYFSPNFDFVKGGKLPGLWGGIHSCSGGTHSNDCFSTRFMWREGGAGEVYAYIPREQTSDFCSRSDVHCNPDYGNSLGRGHWHFQKGHWQNICQYVHMNTVGQTDGYIKVWYNQALVYDIRNVAIRVHDTLNIDGFLFSTFFGGSDSSWAAKTSCDTYYKNFAISMGADAPVPIG